MDRLAYLVSTVHAITEQSRRIALDILYPPTCVVCGNDGAWFCVACQEAIHFNQHAHACEDDWPFASVLACGSYADPVLRRCLTRFKYHSASCLVEDLKSLLKRFRARYLDPWPWAGLSELTITSIPGDERRLRERGMDHAALLVDAVQAVIVPWATRASLLKRQKTVLQNALLPADQTREANVRGAFVTHEAVKGSVLLVDDVLTTGATAVEAAKTLLNAGASAVHLFVLASGK
jgi:predicted amidophosphoribosyltransferase